MGRRKTLPTGKTTGAYLYAHAIIKPMRRHRLTFALFAIAILFSMVREWNAPAVCVRIEFDPASVMPAPQ
jgi:hypothetical protein